MLTVIGILLVACVAAWAIMRLAPENWFKTAALVVLGVCVALYLIKLVTGVGPDLTALPR
jgi:prepilin signal peptidase PulO-like enzyme (type II secretory pathway)